MSLERRIVDLEIRAAFQEKLVAQLDDVLREFAARVEDLERQLSDLQSSMNAAPIGPADDPPPHY